MASSLFFGSLERDASTLELRGSRLADGLRALGLSEGDVVAVLLQNDPVFSDIIHACRIGGTYYCPINWHFTAQEAGFILRDCAAVAVIGHGDLLKAIAPVLPPGLLLLAVETPCEGATDYESWLENQAPYDGPPVSPRNHIAYTSGTTGRPKGVRRLPVPIEELPRKRIQMAELMKSTFGVVPGCRAFVSAPLYHSAPSIFVQQALVTAETLVIASRFDAEETLKLIERHRIDVVYLVPLMYVRLLRLPPKVRNAYELSSLRCIASTGAPCPPDVKRGMIEWLGPIIMETYAATETGPITAITSLESLERPGSVGKAVGEATLQIIDSEGRPCPPHTAGNVYVKQPTYPDFTYHGLAEARRAIERDGLVTLGDIGYLDEDGYLYLCDRSSDLIVSGGVNIYPAEIEGVLLRYPGVADCAVFGIPDQEFGERVHAAVQTEPGTNIELKEVDAFLRTELAGFKIPRSLEIASSLPRDENGKITRSKLRAAHWAGRERRI